MHDNKMSVWFCEYGWYGKLPIRSVYQDLVKALAKALQPIGCRVEVERGSGNEIVSISNIPDNGWDRALEAVQSEQRKHGLPRRGTVTFFRLPIDPRCPVEEKDLHEYKFDPGERLWLPRYCTRICAVDINRIRAAFGSNDQGMPEAIAERYANDILLTDEWFSLEIRHGAPTGREALAQIIAGKIGGPEWAEVQYGFATELLCKYWGHWLGQTNSMGYLVDSDIPTRLIECGPFLPIPRPYFFPNFLFLTAEQVREEWDTQVAHWDEEVEQEWKELRNYMGKAHEKGLGIVTFEY
jgi:hypothetical protein